MHTTLRQTLTSLVVPLFLTVALLPQTGHAASVNGSGRSVTETRNLADFQAVTLHDSMDLVVRQGSTQSVQVQADDNLLALLETTVDGASGSATLHLRWTKGQSLYTRSKVIVTVVVPKLSALSALGSGDIKLEPFNTPALKLSITGSGDAKFTGLTTEELGVAISGSGDVGGTGTATRLKVSIAGSGDVRLADLKADEVSVSIAGSGDAAVNANKTLDVSIAGSGDVSYSGNAIVRSRVAGSGGVSKR